MKTDAVGLAAGAGPQRPAQGSAAAAGVLSADGQQAVLATLESQFQRGVRQRAAGTRGLGS